jgi:hypothetical protein
MPLICVLNNASTCQTGEVSITSPLTCTEAMSFEASYDTSLNAFNPMEEVAFW